METPSNVAQFVAARIRSTGKAQKDIAREAGFEKPNVITMIKQGLTKLPLDRVGPMALALETDPVHLLKLCLAEYHPDTFVAIGPYMDEALTADELTLLRHFRTWVGAPCVAALTELQQEKLGAFLGSLREPAQRPTDCATTDNTRRQPWA